MMAVKESSGWAGPVFIIGAPRSGTSLLRALLNRHPSIGLCDETYYFYYVYSRRRAFGDLSRPTNRQRLIDQYLATHRIRRLGLDLNELNKTLMAEGESYSAFFLALIRFYSRSQGKSVYGEKTPHHAYYVDQLNHWYPDGKILYLIRDPRDVVASLLKMPWASQNVLTNARLWLKCTAGALSCRERESCLLVGYERLVDQPEAGLKEICKFIGVDYSPLMLEPDDSAGVSEWWFQRAQTAPSKDRLGVWRQQLNNRQIALIESVAQPIMEAFGYELSGQVVPFEVKAGALLDELRTAVKEKLQKLPHSWYYWLQPTAIAREEAWIDNRR
jgi:hypothetical protein